MPTTAAPGLDRFCVTVVNLTGEELAPDVLATYAPGMLPIGMGDGQPPRAGSVCVITAPPGSRHVYGGAPVIVLVLPPAPHAASRFQKMWGACTGLQARFGDLQGRVFLGLPEADTWPEHVAQLVATLPPLQPGGAPFGGESADTAEARKPLRTVVAILGLPPGGGKSSLFSTLRAAGAAIASSDEENARGGSFDDRLAALLREHQVVCYDKNVPNVEGLAKMLRVLGNFQRASRFRLRVRFVVPSRLEHDTAWARVRARPPDDIALNIHKVKGGEREAYRIFRTIFFDACESFLATALTLPGVVPTEAFWAGIPAAEALASQVLDELHTAPTLEEMQHGFEAVAAGGPEVGNWVGASLPGTKLHVTLVPPKGASNPSRDRAIDERDRFAAFRRLRARAGGMVRVHVLRYGLALWRGGERRAGFWEVGAVEGLAPDDEFAPQREVYHITDTASLVGVAPREVRSHSACLSHMRATPCLHSRVPADVQFRSRPHIRTDTQSERRHHPQPPLTAYVAHSCDSAGPRPPARRALRTARAGMGRRRLPTVA